MYIFVDESGGFQPSPKRTPISCVAALVVPESLVRTLFRRVHRVLRPWRRDLAELKGSKLDESQMAELIRTVRRFDVLLLVAAIDMSRHSEAVIHAHQADQCRKIRASLRDSKRDDLELLEDFAARLERLPAQLYTQSVLLSRLVEYVFRSVTAWPTAPQRAVDAATRPWPGV